MTKKDCIESYDKQGYRLQEILLKEQLPKEKQGDYRPKGLVLKNWNTLPTNLNIGEDNMFAVIQEDTKLVFDIDDVNFNYLLDKYLEKTLIVKTGNKKRHGYFKDIPRINQYKIKSTDLYSGEKHIGEIKADMSYVVGCGSSYIENGIKKEYKRISSTDQVMEIDVYDLLKQLGLTQKSTVSTKTDKKINSNDLNELKNELSKLKAGMNRQGKLLSLGCTYAATLRKMGLLNEGECIKFVLKLNSMLGEPYPEERATQIGKNCYKYTVNDLLNPGFELNKKFKEQWIIIKNPQTKKEDTELAKQEINRLEEENDLPLYVWDEPKTKEETIDDIIINQAVSFLKEFDIKTSKKKLELWNESQTKQMSEIILNNLFNDAKKRMKKESEAKNATGDDIPPNIKIYGIGKSLIIDSCKSQTNTEQGLVKVMIGNKERWIDLMGDIFRNMVRINTHRQHSNIFSNAAYETAIKNIHAEILIESEKTEYIFNRCAFVDNTLYYDTHSKNGEIYEISKDGINTVFDSSVIFLKRTSTLQTDFPEPKISPGKLDEFFKLCRIEEEDRIVFLSHIMSFFLTGFPTPIMIIHGEQGSAKTTISNAIKSIIDPDQDGALSLPEKVEDLVITVSKRHLSVFDNTDDFDKDFAQAFCKMVTGARFPKRSLYTNDDEFSLYLMSKIILNGISPSINQPDLLERSIFYELPIIKKTDRMTDDNFKIKLDELRPFVLGEMFKILQSAISKIEEIKKECKELPRMASFALWGEAISQALGNEKTLFIKSYSEKIDHSKLELTEEYPVITKLINKIPKEKKSFEDSIANLFVEMIGFDNKDERLPKNSKSFGKMIKTISPMMRTMGYDVLTTTYNERKGDYPRGSTILTITEIEEGNLFDY